MGLFQKVEEMGQRNRIVPAWLRAVIIIPCFILAGYMIVEDVWIYQWIKELQLQAFDGYYVVLTGLLTLLPCLIPALVLVTMARKHYEQKEKHHLSDDNEPLV